MTPFSPAGTGVGDCDSNRENLEPNYEWQEMIMQGTRLPKTRPDSQHCFLTSLQDWSKIYCTTSCCIKPKALFVISQGVCPGLSGRVGRGDEGVSVGEVRCVMHVASFPGPTQPCITRNGVGPGNKHYVKSCV